MIKRKRERKGVILCLISFILIIIGWLAGSVTQAVAEAKQFRIVSQISKAEYLPVGDIEGHVLSMAEARGLVFLDGEVGVYTGWAQGDFIKGVGPNKVYYKLIYEDGSTMIVKTQYTSRISPDGKTHFYEDGKGEFIMGTGRFAGIKGSISSKGKHITPISPGLKETRGDMIVEGTMTYTLPSQ